MKLINAEKVSHIITIGEKQGAWSKWKGWIRMTYLPYRKHTFWEFDKETKQGWYEDGVNGHLNSYLSKEDIEESKQWFLKDNEVYTYPQILIYLGKDLIHKEYFPTFGELEQHLKDNYPKVNIKYEN